MTHRPTFLLAAPVLLLLANCATTLDGGSQPISINTTPSGATCTVLRDADPIATVAATPATIHVDRSRRALTIRCLKEGYPPVEGTVAALPTNDIAGNVILAIPFVIPGIVGAIVDLGTGANYGYGRGNVFITFPQPQLVLN